MAGRPEFRKKRITPLPLVHPKLVECDPEIIHCRYNPHDKRMVVTAILNGKPKKYWHPMEVFTVGRLKALIDEIAMDIATKEEKKIIEEDLFASMQKELPSMQDLLATYGR